MRSYTAFVLCTALFALSLTACAPAPSAVTPTPSATVTAAAIAPTPTAAVSPAPVATEAPAADLPADTRPTAPPDGQPFAIGDMTVLPATLSPQQACEWLGTQIASEIYIEGATGDVVATMEFDTCILTMRNLVDDSENNKWIQNYVDGFRYPDIAPIPDMIWEQPLYVSGLMWWGDGESGASVGKAIPGPRGILLGDTKEAVMAHFPQLAASYKSEPGRIYGIADIWPGTQNQWAEHVGGWYQSAELFYVEDTLADLGIDEVIVYNTITNPVPPKQADEWREYVDFCIYLRKGIVVACSLSEYTDAE